MENTKKRPSKRMVHPFIFEEIDHRLSCGWHAEPNEFGQRKKYLSEIKNTSQEKAKTNTSN